METGMTGTEESEPRRRAWPTFPGRPTIGGRQIPMETRMPKSKELEVAEAVAAVHWAFDELIKSIAAGLSGAFPQHAPLMIEVFANRLRDKSRSVSPGVALLLMHYVGSVERFGDPIRLPPNATQN